MVYQVLTGEEVFKDPRREQGIKDMWGFERQTKKFNIPTENGGTQQVESKEEGTAAAMIRNYWFGRYYKMIDPKW